jgi:hypothetical protein
VEWAKARARADRWEEEVILLDEEMRRVLEFCRWKEAWWKEQVPRRDGVSAPLADGLLAYAEEQADMERHISQLWSIKWAGARKLAQPILQAALGEEPAIHMEDVAAGSLDSIVLDIEDEEGDEEGGGGSDFED